MLAKLFTALLMLGMAICVLVAARAGRASAGPLVALLYLIGLASLGLAVMAIAQPA